MARLRFYNSRVLKNYIVREDEVWIEDGIITDKEGPFDREIDLKGNLIMPSFKNAHAHSGMVFLRSMGDGYPLQTWLEKICWPNEAKLTPDSLYTFTKLAILESLSSGITASLDMYYYDDTYMEACSDAGFKGILSSGLNNFDKDVTNIERLLKKYKDRFLLGIHGEYTTGEERLRYCLDLAEQYKVPCYSHLCETKAEVEGCIERHGMTPPQYLDSMGFYKYGGGGFHCCYMTDEDINLFAEKNLNVVSCPASNLKLASGIAPIEKMRSKGITIALGTDGASSNNALDMFREMYLLSTLQKVVNEDASVCNAADVIEMPCRNSARVMGLYDCDDIDVGKKADLIVIDLNRPNMQPVNDIVANLVYACSKDNVIMTMIDGKILYENGEFHIDEDPQDIYAKANRFVGEIFA